MTDKNPNRPNDLKDAGEPVGRTLPCEEWEALLVDSLDGTLAAADAAAFERHTLTCPTCMELLSRARQGQEWLRFLSPPPAASPDLVAKILARTSGSVPDGLSPSSIPIPHPAAVPFWHRMAVPMRRAAQPRMLMTAAMAFFSVALTLNLAGVRLTGVHIADLNPSLLRTNLTRQFINSKVGVENYCYNLKIVYEMEARVREMKRSSEAEEAPAPAQQQTPSASPKGSAHKGGGKSENPHNPEPRAALWGSSVEAVLRVGTTSRATPNEVAACTNEEIQPGNDSGITRKSYVRPELDRAEGSLA